MSAKKISDTEDSSSIKSPTRLKKRFIVFIILLCVGLWIIFSSSEKKARAVHITGTVQGVETNIASAVSGRIKAICCDEGDMLKKDQIIVELENNELKGAVAQARAGIERARADEMAVLSSIESVMASIANANAEIKNSEAELNSSRAERDDAKRDIDRKKTLYNRKIISQSNYESVTTRHETLQMRYLSAQAKLRSATSGLEAARAQLKTVESQLKSAKARIKEAEAGLEIQIARLEETIIKAPVSGTIVMKAYELGEIVTPGTTIFTIIPLDDLYIKADVEETKVYKIPLNSKVWISLPSDPSNKMAGRVQEVWPVAEFATQRDVVRGRQDIKTFRVKIRPDNNPGSLSPGMTVELEIPCQRETCQ
ncbi:MAG: efflux RND transporter periplasmic adaptor subunit [Pseudomonadota bacterium]